MIIKSIDKALMVIEYLEQKGDARLVTLSRDLGLHPSNACRILATLRGRGFVTQSGNTGRYSLGLRFLEMGNAVRSRLNIREKAVPILEELAQQTGETAFLAVMDPDFSEVVYIEKAEGNSQLVFAGMIGRSAPLHCTAVGKILLSELSLAELQCIIREKKMNKLTRNTITDFQHLLQELEAVKARGYALDTEECEIGVSCVAGPVKAFNEKVVAAISVSGPSNRFCGEVQHHIIQCVTAAGLQLSKELEAYS